MTMPQILDFCENTAKRANDRAWVDSLLASGMSRQFLAIMVRVGNHEVHPALLCESGLGAQAMRKLPMALQTEIIEKTKGVPLVSKNMAGYWETTIEDPMLMNQSEVEQVFGDGTVRTKEEQRAWLNSGSPKPARPPSR